MDLCVFNQIFSRIFGKQFIFISYLISISNIEIEIHDDKRFYKDYVLCLHFFKKKVVSDVLIVVSYPLIHILIEYCVSLARAESGC